jgi:hypothetical protein
MRVVTCSEDSSAEEGGSGEVGERGVSVGGDDWPEMRDVSGGK